EHPWMLDAAGRPTTDPTVVNAEPRGTILPVGGMDHGHKGYALALMVEMLTQGLSGHGRSQRPGRWGANVFLQVMDPEAFGGRDVFGREVKFLNDSCRSNRPAEGVDRVRVPGDRAYEHLERAKMLGVRIPEEVWARVSACASELSVPLPGPIQPGQA
ncbi:MAG: Ldh family oxidoreductase, partial [Paracoccaceae bacterium]|nr:Ldh family oxidoreductase [Paracoccaceae bacterium]